MFGKPSLVAAEIGRYAQSKALLAEEHIAAVTGVDGHDGVVLGELADVTLLFVDVGFRVQTADEIVAFTESVEHLLPHSGHDCHVEHDIDAVGELDADLGEGRADRAHGIGNDIHGPALHRTLVDALEQFVRLVLLHPVVGGTCVLFLFGADEGTAFDARDIVDRRAVQIAPGEELLVELNHLAGRHGFLAECFKLLLASIDENNLVGVAKSHALIDELPDSFVFKFHKNLRRLALSKGRRVLIARVHGDTPARAPTRAPSVKPYLNKYYNHIKKVSITTLPHRLPPRRVCRLLPNCRHAFPPAYTIPPETVFQAANKTV